MKAFNDLPDDIKGHIQRSANTAMNATDPQIAGLALVSIAVMLMKEDPDFVEMLRLFATGDFAGVDAAIDR